MSTLSKEEDDMAFASHSGPDSRSDTPAATVSSVVAVVTNAPLLAPTPHPHPPSSSAPSSRRATGRSRAAAAKRADPATGFAAPSLPVTASSPMEGKVLPKRTTRSKMNLAVMAELEEAAESLDVKASPEAPALMGVTKGNGKKKADARDNKIMTVSSNITSPLANELKPPMLVSSNNVATAIVTPEGVVENVIVSKAEPESSVVAAVPEELVKEVQQPAAVKPKRGTKKKIVKKRTRTKQEDAVNIMEEVESLEVRKPKMAASAGLDQEVVVAISPMVTAQDGTPAAPPPTTSSRYAKKRAKVAPVAVDDDDSYLEGGPVIEGVSTPSQSAAVEDHVASAAAAGIAPVRSSSRRPKKKPSGSFYEFGEDDEIIPEPEALPPRAPSARKRQSKVKEQVGVTAKRPIRKVNYMQDYVSMFHSQDSVLIEAPLNYVLTFRAFDEFLPADTKDELLQLLPEVDCHSLASLQRLFAHNSFFKESIRDFQEALLCGTFEENQDYRIYRRSQRKRAMLPDWKSRHFENYYGEKKEDLDVPMAEPLKKFSFTEHERDNPREYMVRPDFAVVAPPASYSGQPVFVEPDDRMWEENVEMEDRMAGCIFCPKACKTWDGVQRHRRQAHGVYFSKSNGYSFDST